MTGPEARTVAKVLILLGIGILAQTTFGDGMRVDGVAPDFMMLLAVSAGFSGGPDQGALVGFAAGLASDLFLQNTPFGLSALVACLVGFLVGWGRANMLSTRFMFGPFIAAAGTAVGVALFVAIGYIVGQQQLVVGGEPRLVEVAFIEAVYAAVLSFPAIALMSWALGVQVPVPAPGEPLPASGASEFPSRRRSSSARSRRRRRTRVGVR